MRNKQIINTILKEIIDDNRLNIQMLNSIYKSNILNIKQKKLLITKIKKEIKRMDSIIEYSNTLSNENKKLILKNLNNPNIYKFIQNNSLISGIYVKKNWEIYDLSMLGLIEKIKNG